MPVRNNHNNNDLNLFLNEYFSVLLAIILIVFLAGAYFFILGPKFSLTQDTVRSSLETEQKLYETSQKKLASVKAIGDIYKKINPNDLQKFNSVLPGNYVQERLFGELEEVVGRGGWLISSISIDLPDGKKAAPAAVDEDGNPIAAAPVKAEDKKLGKINLEMTINAIDYPGLKNLLKILESNLRLFDVTAVDFSSGSNSAKLVLTTYYYRTAQ